MAAWLISALRMAAAAAAGGIAFGTGAELATTGDVGGIVGQAGSFTSPFIRSVTQVGERKRRRRRRALTASDRADIAFIAGLLGPKAGKDFAVIIGAKGG